MSKALIVLASSTSAYSVKTMLEKRFKIKTRIIRTPIALSLSGCSSCLEIDDYNLKTALSLIKMSTISVRGVYDAATFQSIEL